METKKEKMAFGMNFETFCQLDENCNGFNDEFYKNHQIHEKDESFISFLKKGSESLKNSSMIHKKLN